MPQDCETYVHRIGRTGRAGRAGVTILFVTPRESRMITTIERHTRQSITKIQIPDDREIAAARASWHKIVDQWYLTPALTGNSQTQVLGILNEFLAPYSFTT